MLMNFAPADLAGQPLPRKQRTDDRYELLAKFQGILKTLGFHGIVVLVDRVDEPHLINGSAEQMRALLWPMLDNKFLKHPGIGFKLLLPIELSQYIDREDRDFYQRARLDKQNMMPSLEWTGEALYDVAIARLKACAAPGKSPTLARPVRSGDHRSAADRRAFAGCACRGTCSSSCTGCSSRTATPTPTKTRAGRSPASGSNRCWHSTAAIRTPSIAGLRAG